MFNKVLMAFVLSLTLATQTWAAGSSSKSTKRTSAYETAEKAVEAGDYKRAIPLLQKVVAKNSNHYDALNYLGFSHRQLGENDISLRYYKKVLAMKPDHRGANEYLGELYLNEGKLDLAKKQLAKLDKSASAVGDQLTKIRDADRRHRDDQLVRAAEDALAQLVQLQMNIKITSDDVTCARATVRRLWDMLSSYRAGVA